MIFKRKKTLSMDFDTRSVNMVQGSFKKGKLSATSAFSMDLPQGVYRDGYITDLNLLKEAMDSFLRVNGIKRGDSTVVINSTDILTREIVIPNVPASEIEGIINYKINDYIPIDVDDYIIQYIDQGTFIEEGNEKKKLFIIAVPREIVLPFLDLLKYLDLKPKKLDVKSNSMRKLLNYKGEDRKDNSVENNTIAIVDIGFTNTSLSIFKDNKIELSRTIPLGLGSVLETIDLDLSEIEILRKILFSEIERIFCPADELEVIPEIDDAFDKLLMDLCESLDMVFRYYRSSKIDDSIDLIFIQGEIANLEVVKEKFQEYLNIETLKLNSIHGAFYDELYLYSNALGSLIEDVEL